MRFAFACLSFAALAVAVAAGAFTGLDQWAVDHLMPGAHFNGKASLLDALVPLAGTHWDSAWSISAAVVSVPASFLVAVALVAWRSRVLGVLVIAGTAVETLCKHVLERPALHDGATRISAFDHSFPSGHAFRVLLVAVAFRSRLSAAWAVAAIALIQLAGWHTPSDLLGGLLLGLLALGVRSFLGARGLRGRRLLRRRP